MKLNIGSHNVRVEGFLNVDIEYFGDVDYVCDITETPWKFEPTEINKGKGGFEEATGGLTLSLDVGDSVVDEILMVEVLEHLSFHDTHKVLSEIHRVLKPGGKIHIQVPDCGSMMEMYVMGQISPEVPHKPKSEQQVLDIFEKTGMRVNPTRWLMAFCGAQKYGVPDIHKNIFTKEILQDNLLEAGFSKVDFKDDPLGWKIRVNAYK